LLDANRDYAQVLEEYNSSGVQVAYVYGHDLISQNRTGSKSFYLYDGLGSTKALTDSSGAVTDRYIYDAYGNILSSTGTTQNSYLYTGEQFDSNLGDYYLRDRYYGTYIGRFTRTDTFQGNISDPISLHDYLYANGNPTYFTDPTGMFSMAEAVISSVIISILADLVYPDPTGVTGRGETQPSNPIAEKILFSILLGTVYNGISRGITTASSSAGNSTASSIDDVCFAAGTKVLTPKGESEIQNLKVGDLILSTDPFTGKTQKNTVVKVFINNSKELIEIFVKNEVISTTKEHPFWVPGSGWTKASDIRIGTCLLDKNGNSIEVDNIHFKSGEFIVYNLQVSTFHTYHVSKIGVLVHNTCYTAFAHGTSPEYADDIIGNGLNTIAARSASAGGRNAPGSFHTINLAEEGREGLQLAYEFPRNYYAQVVIMKVPNTALKLLSYDGFKVDLRFSDDRSIVVSVTVKSWGWQEYLYEAYYRLFEEILRFSNECGTGISFNKVANDIFLIEGIDKS